MIKNTKTIGIGIAIVALLIFLPMLVGINDAGHRTVVQYPTGYLYVKFTPGIYAKLFGSIEVYRDVITFDFDKSTSAEEATIDQKGVSVRYQDGGTGSVYGKARYSLPNDEPTMLKLHKAFRSNKGLAHKLIKAVSEEGMNLTAGLMTSEEAYAEKRGIYTQWAQMQVAGGKFQTELKEIMDVEEGTGQRVLKSVPVIKYGKDGRPLQFHSDLSEYGVTISGFQVTDWGFEKKTLDQIARKREATMAIITAKADAERAKQEAITAEQQGKANVMKAKYEKEVEKEKAVVEADKRRQVAVIEASQKVDVAEQNKLEAEQLKLAAAEYQQEQVLRGKGDGEYKRLVMQADGALTQKLETWKEVNFRYAAAIEKQKWVPEIQMGADNTGNKGRSTANDLIELFMVNTARDLKLNMEMKSQARND